MIRAEPLRLRVVDLEPLSPALKRLRLENADGGLLPASQPGAHVSLRLPCERGDRHNAYSVVSACDERSAYELIVRRAPVSRGGSRYIHQAMRVGQILESSAPNSQFSLQSRARRHLLIGGGVGATPLLSFLRELRARRAALEFHLVARPEEIALFERLLEPLAGRDVHLHAGRSGLDLEAVLDRQPLGTHLYACGPEPMMAAARSAALGLGWPDASLHSESFQAAGGRPFTVRLGRSGGEVAVGENESMLEALENAGVAMASLCRGGACGECLTGVLEGIADHRDHVLTRPERAEGRLVLPCVSRAVSASLTLDL